MTAIRFIFLVAISLAPATAAFGQGFENLAFENTTITPVPINPFNGFYDYIATVPGWSWSPAYNAADVNSSTAVSLNDIALDSPSVTLQGTNSPFYPAIQGKYSIFLQGGSSLVPSTSFSSIGQTAQIPSTAESITYWGGPLQVTFNGQPLSFNVISNTPNHSIWGANISAYAGETGQLLFTAPWQTSALLDNIQFGSSPVPEPSTLCLFLSCILLFCRQQAGLIKLVGFKSSPL